VNIRLKIRYLWFLSLSFGLMTLASPGAAEDPRFELPVVCEMGAVCTIQNYFDHDPGPGRMDYACGRLSYDGHDGTDIRVPDLPTMKQGIAVVATAPGVVKGMRDGMPDVDVRKIGTAALLGRDAGNGIVIDHGDGWVTQYSHLRNGSVAVNKGDRVETGQRLGYIGMSGRAEFPHVEFAVRHNGEELDPFVGLARFAACGDTRQPLWSTAALKHLDYQATGPLIAGFAGGQANAETARDGGYAGSRLPADAGALVMWVDLFGTQEGDKQRFRILGPDDRVIHEREDVLDASNVSWFAFSGLKRPSDGWKPGAYRGIYTLTRGNDPVVTVEREVVIGEAG
jgi:murein DD-endopeptidase MepM/ murein hydrolase activator NlpD